MQYGFCANFEYPTQQTDTAAQMSCYVTCLSLINRPINISFVREVYQQYTLNIFLVPTYKQLDPQINLQ